MRDKKCFPRVLLICFLVSTLIYSSIGAMGYTIFGIGVSSKVTLNLPWSAVASKLAIYTTTITPFAKYSLMINPMAVELEEIISTPSSPSRFHVIWSMYIQKMLVARTVNIAIAVPFFGYLMALIGSFLTSSISIIIPCILYLKIFRRRVSGPDIVIIMIILLFGVISCVVGTYSSLLKIAVHNMFWSV
jgi:vesicular inhibitory amino acid transporter